MIDKVADTLLILCIIPSVLFLVNYSTRSKWREELSGRTILYLIISMSLILLQNILSVWIGLEYFGRAWIRCILYGGLFVALCEMNYALRHYQRQSRSLAARVMARRHAETRIDAETEIGGSSDTAGAES